MSMSIYIAHRRQQQAVKPDTGSESRFLPTPPAFDAPVMEGRVSVGVLLCRLARKN